MLGYVFIKRRSFRLPGKTLRHITLASVFALSFILLFAIFPVVPRSDEVSAVVAGGAISDGPEAKASTTSLTMTTGFSSASLDIVPTSSDGTFATSPNDKLAKFSVSTNNSTGYTLTLAGDDDTRQLVSGSGASAVALDSITTSTGITSSDFTSSDDYLNKWGYLPSKYNSIANTTKYYRAPTTTSIATLDATNTANATGTSNNYSIGLGARIDYAQTAGNYTNTFVLAAVGNPVTYTINYTDATGDSSVSGIPSQQSSSTTSTSVTLSSAVPTRTGYTFAGWCYGTVNTTGTHPGTTCSGTPGTTHAASSSLAFIDQTATSSNVNTITLQALWTANVYNITYDYQNPTTYLTDAYTDTKIYMDWSKDFKIEETFSYTTTGLRYLIIGNYPEATQANDLNIEISGDKLRLYMGRGTINDISTTSLPTNTNISIIFNWDAHTKVYSLTAAANGMSNISMIGTYNAPNDTAGNPFYVNRDHRGTGTFSPLTVSTLKITKPYTYGTTLSDLPATAQTGHTFTGWYTAVSAGTQISSSTAVPAQNTTYYGRWTTNSYTQTTMIRYENINGTWGSYTQAESKSLVYGNTYSWSTAATTVYQAANVAGYSVTESKTNYVDIKRNRYSFDVNPTINGTVYGSGSTGYTFDVYIDGVLVADDMIDWASWHQGASVTDEGYLRYGQVIRIVGNTKNGYTMSNGDKSYTITSNTATTDPAWTANTYNITYLGGEIYTGYDNSSVTLAQGSSVPVYASNYLSLSTNTNYTVSFDYVGTQASNNFDVDFIPDTLPQYNPIATTTLQHYDWTTSSSNSDMGSARLRFFDDIADATNYGGVTISNIMLSQPNVQSKTYGNTLGTLPSVSKTGYTFNGFYTAPSGGTQVTSSTAVPAANTTYYGHWTPNTYTITLSNTSATTSGSTSTTATYGSTTLGSITNPSRSHTVSGFSTSYNNASGATVSSTATKTYNYTFNGWYTASSGGSRVISSGKALTSNLSGYTDTGGRWTRTSSTTLYSQWSANNSAITLPTITKDGHTCGWSTSTSTSTITYASGGTITPTANTTLYGVCIVNNYTVTLKTNTGISSVALKDNSGNLLCTATNTTGVGCTVTYGQTYFVFATMSSGYRLSSWANTVTKYSYTPNINDAGTANGNYGNNLSLNQVITIPGASSLNISLTYQTESTSYDWVSFWAGNYPSYTASSNYSSGVQWSGTGSTGGKYGGTTKTTLSGSISGDTVTFGFRSDSSVVNYGYYAVISGTSTSNFANPTDTISSYTAYGNAVIQPTATTIPDAQKMQNFTKSQCSSLASSANYTVYDLRDGNDYTVRYINGNCWMTQNLRFAGSSLTTSDSNVSSNTTITWYDLSKNGSGSGVCNQTNGYNYACMHIPNPVEDESELSRYTIKQMGAYYNYAGASAMTITGSSNSTIDTYNICPKGWTMPSSSQANTLGSSSYTTAFQPLYGGHYYNGSPSGASTAGFWWPTNAVDSTKRYRILYWNAGSIYADTYDHQRYFGSYVRCLRSS